MRRTIHCAELVIAPGGPPLYENCFDIRAMLPYISATSAMKAGPHRLTFMGLITFSLIRRIRMRKVLLFVLATLVFSSVTAFAAELVSSPTLKTAAVQLATRSQLLQQLNKSVKLEGYYYDGSIPMLVEDMQLVQSGVPIPPDKYVPITGPIPSSLKPGARVAINGMLQKAPRGDLAHESVVLQFQSAPSIQQGISNLLTPQTAINTLGVMKPKLQKPIAVGKRYALLIGTGSNMADTWVRFWNDVAWMHYIMVNDYDYDPANIRVLYANGYRRPGSKYPMTLNGPATWSDVQAAFAYFASKMTANDELYIFMAGLGANPGSVPGAPTAFWLLNYPMTPTMFAGQVNRIINYKRIVVHMNQAYCGYFIPSLTRPKRIIVTTAAANKNSYAHPSLSFNNFNYWYLSALRGKMLIGDVPVNFDINHDGKVSLAEAYNFTLGKPGSSAQGISPIDYQMPQFEDNGTVPSRFGPLPSGSEGIAGMSNTL